MTMLTAMFLRPTTWRGKVRGDRQNLLSCKFEKMFREYCRRLRVGYEFHLAPHGLLRSDGKQIPVIVLHVGGSSPSGLSPKKALNVLSFMEMSGIEIMVFGFGEARSLEPETHNTDHTTPYLSSLDKAMN